MPFNTNGGSSLAPAGAVLGATTAAAAGSQVLPRTGLSGWVFYLVLATIVSCSAIVISFVATRVIKRFI